jgi:hypothetical protein
MVSIKFSKNKNLFYIEMTENINHVHILFYIDIICDTPLKDMNIIILTDYRKATIAENSAGPIEKIGNHVNTKMKKYFNSIKWASLSYNYLPTTGAMILGNLIKDSKLDYRPFTTIEGALQWANITQEDLINMEILHKY